MDESTDSQPSGVGYKLFSPLYGNQNIDIDQNAYNAPKKHKCYTFECHFSISSASLGVVTHEFAEYHAGLYNTILEEP